MTPGQGIFIRNFDPARDTTAVQAIDTSFTTDIIYNLNLAGDSFHLEPMRISSSRRKRFEIDLGKDQWDQAYVAIENGDVRGFIAANCEQWNRRLAIRHFYVDLSHRRRGIGRLLMDHAIVTGRRMGAATAWIETSNCNGPGITAYRQLGFSLCGCDATLYQSTPCESEFAIFLARPIAGS